MKKILFVLLALIATVATVNATIVTVTLTNDQTIDGTLISMTDTSLTMVPSYSVGNSEIVITPGETKSFTVKGIGRYDIVDGKFVPSPKALAKLKKMQEQTQQQVAADPNQVIAKAFKSTGDVCMGIGIPSAITGLILVAYGNSSTSGKNATSTILKKSQCAAAGYVLLPMGAALTVVGIPLHVQGKKIGQLNINYTGNGAGMSVNF